MCWLTQISHNHLMLWCCAFILKILTGRIFLVPQVWSIKKMIFAKSSHNQSGTVRGVMSCCECRQREDAARGSILYSILNRGAQCPRGHLETATAQQLCSCACKRKLVLIRAPGLVFKAASEVLVKTFRFVKNVPCFRGLPTEDQLRLVRNSWAPLLVLGMVQDAVDFDTVETQQPSLLHSILTHSKERQQRTPAETQDPGVPVGDAEGIKMFLVRCRGLRISVKEYAFLKGAILFTPGNTVTVYTYSHFGS